MPRAHQVPVSPAAPDSFETRYTPPSPTAAGPRAQQEGETKPDQPPPQKTDRGFEAELDQLPPQKADREILEGPEEPPPQKRDHGLETDPDQDTSPKADRRVPP